MSYDLYLKPRNGSIDRAAFQAFFEQNPLFTIDDTGVTYENEATGTYFSFWWQEIGALDGADDEPESKYPIFFNLNFFSLSSYSFHFVCNSS